MRTSSDPARGHLETPASSASVRIRIPGSTSNLGSGFDTLGLALRIYNTFTVAPIPGNVLQFESESGLLQTSGFRETLQEAANLFFQQAGIQPFGLSVHFSGEIPVARGLGSSVTGRLAIIAALNELTSKGWDRQKLLDLVTQLEHHPDNAAPAIFGGFTVAGSVDSSVRCFHFPVSQEASFICLIPNLPISTTVARKLMPDSYSKADTAHALNRAALITAALASGQLESLRGLFDDRVHQPYREALAPSMRAVIRAGIQAGAIGGFLSGSGSSIICVASQNADAVAKAMQSVLPDSTVRILLADNQGFQILQTNH